MDFSELSELLSIDNNTISNLANAAAYLYNIMDNINWLGFYIVKEKDNNIFLGPFQGKPACVNIPVGKGVCGKALVNKKIIVVDNVNEFAGHIVCDNNSKSEIVIPLYFNNEVVALLDVDSPILSRFGKKDKMFLSKACNIIENKCKWSDI